MNEQIHWSEGLFLQPHHLQTLQRQLLVQTASERTLECSYPYGLVEAELSVDELKNHLVRFSRLRAVMPSGVLVDFPNDSELPPLDVTAAFKAAPGSVLVYLAVPLWHRDRANSIETGSSDDWRIKRVYRVGEIKQCDENTGENPQPIRVRRINARLMLDGEDRTDLEYIPLLRIKATSDADLGAPREDQTFFPPCLVLSGCGAMRKLLTDLSEYVRSTRTGLAQRLARATTHSETLTVPLFRQMLFLRTLSRFGASLPGIVAAPATTPFALYLLLRELLAELAAICPERPEFEIPPYNHADPAAAFRLLDQRIREFKLDAGDELLRKIDFVPARRGVVQVALSDTDLKLPNQYFLGVRTGEDPGTVSKLVQDPHQFKLMSGDRIQERDIGIKLREERNPPAPLPISNGLVYFNLLRDETDEWVDYVVHAKSLAATWPEFDSHDFKLTLYMTLPK